MKTYVFIFFLSSFPPPFFFFQVPANTGAHTGASPSALPAQLPGRGSAALRHACLVLSPLQRCPVPISSRRCSGSSWELPSSAGGGPGCGKHASGCRYITALKRSQCSPSGKMTQRVKPQAHCTGVLLNSVLHGLPLQKYEECTEFPFL